MSTEVRLEGHRFYQLGAAVNPGNSGGPAFNDLGQVIGVVTAKAARQESIGFCIPVDELISVLEGADSPSMEQLDRIQNHHDVEAVVRRLHIVGRVNSAAVEAYLSALNRAAQAGGSLDFALRQTRREIGEQLAATNRRLTGDMQSVVDELVVDSRLSPQIRRDLSAIWSSFCELRDSAENPRGNIPQFVSTARRARARFLEQVENLHLAMGNELSD
jgi:serine protease Do